MGHYKTIIIMLFSSMVAFYVFVLIIKIKRKIFLSQRKIEYEQFLQQARRSRLLYIRAAEQTDKYNSVIEYKQEEMTIEKANLKAKRIELRKHLLEIRIQCNKKMIAKFELKAIELQKLKFREQWSVLDSMKQNFIKNLEKFRDLKKELAAHLEKDKCYCEQWATDKKKIFSLYKVLSAEIVVTDPRVMLSSD